MSAIRPPRCQTAQRSKVVDSGGEGSLGHRGCRMTTASEIGGIVPGIHLLGKYGGDRRGFVTMLTCIPQSLCSWDFRVIGASTGPAALTFNFFNEQGSISISGTEYAVRKHGPLSGHWTLERNAHTYADAQKPSAMFRSFEVQSGAVQLTVKAQSVLGRCYDILTDSQVVGTIRPAHPFTRRAFIECSSSVPELEQLFSFWLAVVTWRRAANSSSAGT